MAWKSLGTLTLSKDWQSLLPIQLPSNPSLELNLGVSPCLIQTSDTALFRFLRSDRLIVSSTYEINPTPDSQILPITLPQEPAEVWQWTPQLVLVRRAATYTAPWTLTLHLYSESLELLLR